MHRYKAKLIKVIDGDTIDIDIDLGFNIWIKKERVRLARINAPETRGEQKPFGVKAKNFLKNTLKDKEILIHTEKNKKGKYGRYITEIYINDCENVNDMMVENGFAIFVKY